MSKYSTLSEFFTKHSLKLITAVLASATMALSIAASASVKVEDIRIWNSPEKTRLVFDIDRPVKHNIFPLSNPNRIVIDLDNTATSSIFKKVDFSGSNITSMRVGLQKNDVLRVVLDLRTALTPKSNLLEPNQRYGHRLVVDLHDQTAKQVRSEKTIRQPLTGKGPKDVVIAIDAGHGGEDPGALGPSGTYEKNVTLAIAKELQQLINAQAGMRAVMTRTGDYYIGLKRRREIARDKHHADLFVSIHADAWKDPRARGASVWVLSQGGATKALNVYLENLERESDSIGGVDLEDKDNVLKSVLVDIAMEGTMEHSFKASNAVLSELQGVARLHKKHVEQANFVVLKSPDMPSMLVELGFISNPKEEALMTSQTHQRKFANALIKGIKSYFVTQPPPGTYFAALRDEKRQTHVIGRGETLSGIAKKYGVSMGALKEENGLKGNEIRIGQGLRIPRG